MSAEEDGGVSHPLPDRDRLFLLYHELQPTGSEYSYAMDSRLFGEHLAMMARVRTKMPSAYFPEVTFDDGHLSNYEVALPMLEQHGFKATFFITAGWTGNKASYMGWKEILALREAGHRIGAHGWTHKLLTHCDADELQEQLMRSRLTLEDKLGSAVTSMSLPGGRSNAGVLRACWDNGYTQIFTSEPKAEADVSGATAGRLNLHGNRTAGWLEKVLQPESGLLRALWLQYKVKAGMQAIAGDRLYEKAWALLNRQKRGVEDQEAGSE